MANMKSSKNLQLQNGNGNTKALQDWLKSAADLLRGRSEGLQYIITLLFYKRLCDVFDDEVAEIKQDLSQLDDKEFRKVVKEAKLTRFLFLKKRIFKRLEKQQLIWVKDLPVRFGLLRKKILSCRV